MKNIIRSRIIRTTVLCSLLISIFAGSLIIAVSTGDMIISSSTNGIYDIHDTLANGFKRKIKHDETNIVLLLEKKDYGKIEELIVEKTNPIKTVANWNETPMDYLSENNHITQMLIYPIDKDGHTIEPSSGGTLKIPMPDKYSEKYITVYQTTETKGTRLLKHDINNDYIELDSSDAYGTITIINDKRNKYGSTMLDICGISLKYENSLTMKVKADVFAEKIIESKMLMWKEKQDKYSVDCAEFIGKQTPDGFFEIKNIEFKDIDKTMYICLYTKTENGEYYSDIIKYDILQYCINIYKNTEDTYLKELILGTIIYADRSKTFEGEESSMFDSFAKQTNYTKTIKETTDGLKVNVKNLFSTSGENCFYGRNVLVNNKIVYQLYLKPEHEHMVNDLYVEFTMNGKKKMVKWEKDFSHGFYKAVFDNINPYDINSPIFIQMYTKDGKPYGGVITDSIGTFIYNGLPEYTTEKDQNMFVATTYFMEKCERYFTKKSQSK